MVKKLSPSIVSQIAREHGTPERNICCVCGVRIQVMAFQGTGVCGEIHRKDRDDDHAPWSGAV